MNIYDIQKKYLEQSYFLDYRDGYGLSEILEVLTKYSVRGDWLDLGCGGNSYLWRMCLNHIDNMTLVDKYSATSILINEMKNKQFKKGCYKYAFENFCCSNIEEIYSTPYEYVCKDLLKEEILFEKKYNNVSQIGLLGLCENPHIFKIKIFEILKNLKKNGVSINANWLFNSRYSEILNIDNSYITELYIKNILSEHENYQLEYINKIKFNDEKYTGVMIYVIRRVK